MPTPPPTPAPKYLPQSSVQVLYAIPSDQEYDPFLAQSIRDLSLDVQSWYGEQLDGSTFSIAEPLPLVCEMDDAAKKFQGKGGWGAVMDGVQHCAPVDWYSELHTWVIFVPMKYPCDSESYELGQGAIGIVILHADVRGLQQPEFRHCDDWYEQSHWVWAGGLAHELGHAFGLHHPSECDESPNTCRDKSMMWLGWFDYPDTYLRDEDKAYLKALIAHHRSLPRQ